MSVRRRKKAISKIIKLLNLATSTNTTESIVALRHAEALIRQYNIAQRELPVVQLYDRTLLYKVSWNGAAPRFIKETPSKAVSSDSVYSRRFSEKRRDDKKQNSTASLDGVDESLEQEAGCQSADHELGRHDGASEVKTAGEVKTAAKNDSVERDEGASMFETKEMSETKEMPEQKEMSEGMESAFPNNAVNGAEKGGDNVKRHTQEASGSLDNVIDAAQAFRPEVHAFAEALKPQPAVSESVVDFSDDVYWKQVHEELADFDEAGIQAEMESIKQRLQQSESSLQRKKAKRHQQERSELQKRAERAKIELSFEEAIEKAFQARAVAYEAWEKEQCQQRLMCLREEQEALAAYEVLVQDLNDRESSLNRHMQRKEDYHAAKIMHDLRRHLALSAAANKGASSFEKVVEIMAQNALSLKDLEFSDIQNKSLFIRLLERESALIADVHEREQFTEAMLEKFLSAGTVTRSPNVADNPIQHIQRLLTTANKGGQFETQKCLAQVQRLMSVHDISVRQIGYGYIKKYSVFISLINWEAERITSLSEREAFTAQILEEYIQYSVQAPEHSSDQKITPR